MFHNAESGAIGRLERRALAVVVGLGLMLSSASVSRSRANEAGERAKCPTNTVPFRGKCLAKYECCLADLCPDGQVLEYTDKPECVPCEEATAQQAISFCVRRDLDRANADLNALYKTIIDEFTENREKVKKMEKAWIKFRDSYCEVDSSRYEGGSAQGEVVGRCLEKETRRQIERLKELKGSLSEGR